MLAVASVSPAHQFSFVGQGHCNFWTATNSNKRARRIGHRTLQFLIISIVVAWPVIGYLSGQWLQNFAYHVPLTAWYFILPGCIALGITLVTSGYHGVKSALVNPVDTLKHE